MPGPVPHPHSAATDLHLSDNRPRSLLHSKNLATRSIFVIFLATVLVTNSPEIMNDLAYLYNVYSLDNEAICTFYPIFMEKKCFTSRKK